VGDVGLKSRSEDVDQGLDKGDWGSDGKVSVCKLLAKSENYLPI
jgi:hypothetical protein